MQFYISVMFLGLPDDIHEEKPSFLQFKKNALRTHRPTDGRTDGRTDRPSYRDARTHLKILHENACLPTVKERLRQLGLTLLGKMKGNNPLVREIVQEKEDENIRLIRQQGLNSINRSHRSPLDILLPAQRPFLNST